MPRFNNLTIPSLLLSVFLYSQFTKADCECGYTVNSTSSESYAIFTDLLESDFTLLHDIRPNYDWKPQVWSLDPKAALGPYGRTTTLDTIVTNPAINITNTTDGINGGHAGMSLVVPSKPIKIDGAEYLKGAELDSTRTDMFYGTFRAAFQLSPYAGTCFGFYWYYNDSQEIDTEFLSAQVNSSSTLVNLVLHTPVGGSNTQALPGTYDVVPLPFDLSRDIHELRFDWTPNAVTWYADGNWAWEIDNSTLFPRKPGHIVLTHWSNGDPLWSGGPPVQDAKLLVTYVKAYFNSSDTKRNSDYDKRCTAAGLNSTRYCQIPDQEGPPAYGTQSGQRPYFFSEDKPRNAINGQVVYQENAARAEINKLWKYQMITMGAYAIVQQLEIFRTPGSYFYLRFV